MPGEAIVAKSHGDGVDLVLMSEQLLPLVVSGQQ